MLTFPEGQFQNNFTARLVVLIEELQGFAQFMFQIGSTFGAEFGIQGEHGGAFSVQELRALILLFAVRRLPA